MNKASTFSRIRELIFNCTAFIFIIFSSSGSGLADDKRPLMRFPDIHENTVVFVYGEDIWTVPVDGGVARRLTIHEGQERYPKFSPDGTMIAFSGEYDGNTDVYVMNIDGGDIRRVTYHPEPDVVIGWHPLENKIMFRSVRSSYSRFFRLFLINPDGNGLRDVSLCQAAQASYSPDGQKIAYTRTTRENATWKRYRGGQAEEIYIYDFETNQDRNITRYERTDRFPMWIGNKIYFNSDRDGVLNIHSYDTITGRIEQITHHRDYDVRRPGMGGNRIVYELGGTLRVLDVTTQQSMQIPVEIRADAPEVRPYLATVDEFISGIGCSPSGNRALVVARGEIFTIPKKEGPTRNLTNDSGSRDKDATWSPDGKTIAYLSDKSGEYEIYLVDPLGRSVAVKLTSHRDGYRHSLRWSPDSKKIAFADQTLRCYYLDVQTKKITVIDKAEYENIDISLDLKPFYDLSWSTDSRFIAYTKMNADLVNQVTIYSLETGKTQCVSDGLYNDFNPVFSSDGEHLFFISNRRFTPTFCDFEWEMVYKNVAGIYALTLKRDGAPCLPLKSDEVENKPPEEDKNVKKTMVIDFEGIAGRIEEIPVKPGNYRRLATFGSNLYYLNAEEGDFNQFEFRPVESYELNAFSLESRKERNIVKEIAAYQLSTDGSSIVYQKADAIGIIDAMAEAAEADAVDLSDLKMRLDPAAEWRQMFNEAWRMERDFYYDPNMHGIDWNSMKVKYGRLLPYVSSNLDIAYLIGELIAELNTSHTYVTPGERNRTAEPVNVGMLGVDWRVDTTHNRFQFEKIMRVPDWTKSVLPPLSVPGINIHENDYLIAVNGVEVTADREVYAYFQDTADKQVQIVVNDKPTRINAREYTVEPLASEKTLRYVDWLERNRMTVDRESGGQVGYLHLPDTFEESAREFPKYFYSQTRKKGLIIDGRFNAGGLDPDIFLQRLAKRPLVYWTRRYSHDQTTPSVATNAHMVCLTNREAGSGGDMLPMEFQLKGLGPVIGTRTWGGLVGVSMFIEMIDGGTLSAPDYRVYDPQGRWVVENEGVRPDIEIDLDHGEMARGIDAQLMKGIDVLMKKIEADPRPWPGHQPFQIDTSIK